MDIKFDWQKIWKTICRHNFVLTLKPQSLLWSFRVSYYNVIFTRFPGMITSNINKCTETSASRVHSDYTMTQCMASHGCWLDVNSLVHTHIKSPKKWLPEALRYHRHFCIITKVGIHFAVPRRVVGRVDPNTAGKVLWPVPKATNHNECGLLAYAMAGLEPQSIVWRTYAKEWSQHIWPLGHGNLFDNWKSFIILPKLNENSLKDIKNIYFHYTVHTRCIG